MAPTRNNSRIRRAAHSIHDYRTPRITNQGIALRALQQQGLRSEVLHLFPPHSASRVQVDTYYGLQDIQQHVCDLTKLVTDFCDSIEAESVRIQNNCHRRFLELPVFPRIADWARTSVPHNTNVFPAALGPLCQECGIQGHTMWDCPQYFCIRCNTASPGHPNGECPRPSEQPDALPLLVDPTQLTHSPESAPSNTSSESMHIRPLLDDELHLMAPPSPPAWHPEDSDDEDEPYYREHYQQIGRPSWAYNPAQQAYHRTQLSVWALTEALEQVQQIQQEQQASLSSNTSNEDIRPVANNEYGPWMPSRSAGTSSTLFTPPPSYNNNHHSA